MVKIVCIGGGTGQSILLSGLRRYTSDLTAIVAVTDSGRSTGVLRDEFDILAPGDIRNCLVSLSNSPRLLKDLFRFRFESDEGGSYHGVNFGNLFITALTKLNNDNFSQAIKDASRILKIDGRVLPSTLKNTHVCAELSSGEILEGEACISRSYGKKKKIKKLFLKDDAVVNLDCVSEILGADLIVIGPGGLYTSLIANLLPQGMVEAIKKSGARKVYVANAATQVGVTDGFDLFMHVKEVEKYLGKGVLDFVILNGEAPSKELTKRYEKEGAKFLMVSDEEVDRISKLVDKVLVNDLIQEELEEEFGKPLYIRHDSVKLAKSVMSLARGSVKGVILVAGKGSRMKPFSIKESKEMIRFFGKPLIAHHADEFISNGVEEVVFVCNDENIEKIRSYVLGEYSGDLKARNGSARNVSFKFVLQPEQRGPVNALLYARSFLENDFFIVKYGDSIAFSDQTHEILDKFNQDPLVDCVVTLRKVKKPQEYGIAKFRGDKLVAIVEKPQKDFPSNLANVGIVLVNGSKFFSAVDDIGVEEVLPPAEYILRKKGRASYWVFKGERVDVGRAWNVLEAHKLFAKKFGSVVLSKKIGKNVKLGRGVFVGKDAVIGDDSEIKSYSSVEGSVGENCVISKSVLKRGSKIGSGSKILSSVIGKNTKVGKNFYTKVKKQNVEVYCKDKYVPSGKNELGLFVASDCVIKDDLFSEPGRMVFPNKLVKKPVVKDLLLRALVFDADNTVYQTKKSAKSADMAAMRFFAKQIKKSPEVLYDFWKKKIVSVLVESRDPKKRVRLYSYNLLAAKFGFKDVLKGYELFKEELLRSIELSPGFKELMPSLGDYKIGLVSEDSRDLLDAKLQKFKLTAFFDCVVSSDDVGVMKPHKRYVDLALNKLDVSSSECLFIGDNYEKDLKIAESRGANVYLYKDADLKKILDLLGDL